MNHVLNNMQYAATCMLLLRANTESPNPAVLPQFVARILTTALEAPSVDNIKMISTLMSSTTIGLLDITHADLLTRLQDQMILMLRGSEAEDPSANLRCLFILAKIASLESVHPEIMHLPLQTADNRSSPKATSAINDATSKFVGKYGHAKQFFVAKRAFKTLDLVVLKAILACSRGCGLSSNDTIDSLNLSAEIIDFIGPVERGAWRSKNAIKEKKLCEKIMRPEIDTRVRCAVCPTSQTTGNQDC